MSADSTKKTLMVALGVCLVCSVLVSSAAVALSGIQAENKTVDRITNILVAGDLLEDGIDVKATYSEKVEASLIELSTGEFIAEDKYTEVMNPEKFDIKRMAADSEFGEDIDPGNDIAGIKRKPKNMVVYRVMDGDKVGKYILPLYGKGLWSTMYGFMALDNELKIVEGFTFYEHGETPGLGGEVDNPNWKATWKGKEVYNDQGELAISVIKGKVDNTSSNAKYQIDGLSGSTLTTRGVHNLVRFWLGDNGYGPFIAKVKAGGHDE